MGRAPGNQGHKGERIKNNSDSYYKGRYYITFYKEEDDDEEFYAGFNNVVEICKYLKWEITTTNINKIHQMLYKVLYKKEEAYTKMIDGIKLKVYTNLPGFQFYTSNHLGKASQPAGKSGSKYEKRSALCIEPQFYPNAINTKGFKEKGILKKGEIYNREIIYSFSS